MPFMSHIDTSPLVSCQRMSLLPSPLKSPVPMIDHLVATLPRPADDETVAPFMNHIARLPLVSRQRRSALAVAVEVAGSDDRPRGRSPLPTPADEVTAARS